MPSISRICRPTAINSRGQQKSERLVNASPGALCICRACAPARRAGFWLVGLLLAVLMTGCGARAQTLAIPFTSVRPVAQVGVLAPFEGLYRRSGYSALESVRGAIAIAPPAHTGIIPLALDTSLDPARAAAKLAASTNMRAVVGPLTPPEGAAAAPALATLHWFAPWAVADEGFVSPQGTRWLEALVTAMGAAAQAQGAQRLLVGGVSTPWEPLLREGFGPLPTIQYVSAHAQPALLPGDALIWLGSAADGATAARAVRAAVPDAAIWLAPWAVDPVFFEHLAAAEKAAGDKDAAAPVAGIHTILWMGPHYTAWANTHAQLLPPAYLMYEAALQGATAATSAPGSQPEAQAPWTWQAVVVTPQGVIVAALP
jgi:hypothetical protein